MPADRRPDHRERLLRQLTRLREVEHRQAAFTAGTALDEAQRKARVAHRAQLLAADAGDPARLALAHDLAASLISGTRIRELAQHSAHAAEAARALAEARLGEERNARHKLDRLEDQRSALAHAARQPDAGEATQIASRNHLARIVNSEGDNR